LITDSQGHESHIEASCTLVALAQSLENGGSSTEPMADEASSAQLNLLSTPVEPSIVTTKTSAPETLLILDTETSGLDPQEHQCLEVGAILFSVPEREVLVQQSFLLPVESNAAEAINHIPASATRRHQPWKEGLRYLQALMDAADLLVAHHAAFDRQWFGQGRLPEARAPWLCTMEDIRWPAELQLRSRPSVRDLALAHGVPVWAVHRALADCVYIAEVFRRREDLEQLLEWGMEPRVLMRAQVSYDERHLARSAGFRWNDPVQGAWTRRLSAREAQDLEFPVIALDRDEPLAS
jgi:DNA polymerase-3 subunit epsilon